MRPKSLALLVLALGCGLVASIGITQVMANRDAKSDAPTGDSQAVFVAMESIPMGEVLTPQVLRLENWPKDKVPSGALSKIEDVEGRRSRTRLYEGEPILENKLYGKGDSGGGVAMRIPKGYRAVPVKVDDVSGGADMILPGDRVDVVVYLSPKRGSAGITEASTQTLLEDIKVFAVDSTVEIDSTEAGSEPMNAKTISLQVTPEQAAKLTLASQLGKIILVMRSPDDPDIVKTKPVSAADLFHGMAASNRDTEEPKPDAGKDTVSDWLSKLQQPQPAEAPAVIAEKPDIWGVRIWSGPESKDLILQANAGNSGGNTGAWTIVEKSPEGDSDARYEPTGALPEMDQPPADPPQPPAAEEQEQEDQAADDQTEK
ncbi:MAG: Flp pilus assembly protein CpaB [Planctomycetes bacterium RBG_13_63_9]|nr:MAG: Flp pilus assembly protein CpaB [Planctomycetes bacterium RBG_13_63_9]